MTYLSNHIEDAIRRGYETAEDIAQFVGASLHDVHRILRESSFLSNAVRDESLCHRCGEAPALPKLEYCARCQKALNSHVQRAVEALRAQVEQMGSKPPFERDLTNSDPSGMKSELTHKRRRRFFHRKSPTARNRSDGSEPLLPVAGDCGKQPFTRSSPGAPCGAGEPPDA